jgi:radical SAM protein with 4Fe4S-binding SPASM domain
VKEIIKEAKELGMRQFDPCGGELLLYENWETLIKELIDAGYRPYISTKIPISENDIKKLKDLGQKEIQLSIDSIRGDELKNILKVDLNYIEKIKKTLKYLEKEKMDVYINSQITNFNNNTEHIKHMLEYFLTFNNIKRIKVGHIGRSIYLDPDVYANISSTYDNIKKIEDLVELYKNKYHDIDISFSGYSKKDKYISDDLKIKAKNYNERVKCSGNFYGFIILPNGKVTICEELYFHPAFIIGNLKNQSIMEVWNSKRALELYRLPKEKIRKESACKTCPQDEYERCRQIKGVCWKEILSAYNHENWDYPDPKCPHAPIPLNKFWIE